MCFVSYPDSTPGMDSQPHSRDREKCLTRGSLLAVSLKGLISSENHNKFRNFLLFISMMSTNLGSAYIFPYEWGELARGSVGSS